MANIIPIEVGEAIKAMAQVRRCSDCGKKLCMYNYSVYCFAYQMKNKEHALKVMEHVGIELKLFGRMKVRDRYFYQMGNVRKYFKKLKPEDIIDVEKYNSRKELEKVL